MFKVCRKNTAYKKVIHAIKPLGNSLTCSSINSYFFVVLIKPNNNMKKLIYALMAISLLACGCEPRTTPSGNNNATVSAGASLMSLNGIPENDARAMIKNFRDNLTSVDSQTSFWFSKEFLDAILNAAENAPVSDGPVDGIRIHLAKRAVKISLIVLLTKKVGPYDDDNPKFAIHRDFFSQQNDELNSAEVRNIDSYVAPKGADLFRQDYVCVDAPCNAGPNFLSCTDAKQWVGNFFKAHSGSSVKINTRSVWYSIDLIGQLKKEFQALRDDNKEPDGIRIYLSLNDDKKNCFIIVPTYKMPGGIHQDNYKCYFNKLSPYDRGEECPTFCEGVTVP
jgi:hypothetical protein